MKRITILQFADAGQKETAISYLDKFGLPYSWPTNNKAVLFLRPEIFIKLAKKLDWCVDLYLSPKHIFSAMR